MKERKVREVNTSSDAAEQIVRISLEGFEVAARLSGSGAKNVAAALVAIAKDQQKVRGKTTLTNMLKSGRPLKVFSIKTEDLQKFSEVLFDEIRVKTDMAEVHVFEHGGHPAMLSNMDEFFDLCIEFFGG